MAYGNTGVFTLVVTSDAFAGDDRHLYSIYIGGWGK